MPTKVVYTAHDSFERTANIREFVCRVQNGAACKDQNPLPEFNRLLDWCLEHAFYEGVNFGRAHPSLDVLLHSSPPEINK